MINKLKFFAAILLLLNLFSCSKESDSNPVQSDPNDDLTISTISLNFVNGETEKTLVINIASGKKIKWTLRRSKLWLNFDAEEGTESKNIVVSVNRFRMVSNFETDTIVIAATSLGKTSGESSVYAGSKKIPVTISKGSIQLLEEKIGNSIKLPTTIDTTATLLATAKIKQGSIINLTTAAGAFYQGTKFFADAGNISLRAKSSANTDRRDSIPFKKSSFSFTDPITKTQSTAYYLTPETPKLPPTAWPIDFDGTTFHNFKVMGSGGFPSFKDSIASVTEAALTSPSDGSTVSKSSDLVLSWTPTSASDDKVFAVIVASSDTSKRITAAIADDNSGSLVISASKMKTLNSGSATLYFVRFRYRIDVLSGYKVGLLTLSQRTYSLTIN